ncbi:MAG: 3-oxoacyl-[acyl-carrier-protein] reductase [Bacteroidales bacterium]|nr:3-oxoacyl-[acyl-carrier-protein] reductase [Bacteroidales bacterium]
MMILENKTAIITGGTRGIGRAIVEKFAQEGAKVVFTGTSQVSSELEKALNAIGAAYEFVRADAASLADAEKVCETCMNRFGRVDILVNNAGITRDMLLMMMSEKDWDDVVAVNLKSVFNYTKVVSSVMLRQRLGSIVNLSSVAGVVGNPGQCNYAATKAGIIGFTKSIAKEIGRRNIRCNAIAPGLIDTDMTRNMPAEARDAIAKNISLRRIGKPEEIANTALFLASDLSSYISGQVIICDGGM